MDTLIINQQKKSLFIELELLLDTLLAESMIYLNNFEIKDFFSFSNSEERIKYYKSEYLNFSSNIALPIEGITAKMYMISALLIESDQNMLEDTSAQLKSVFEEYLTFEATLASFTKETKTALSKEQFSVSMLTDCAKKIIFSTNALKSKLK